MLRVAPEHADFAAATWFTEEVRRHLFEKLGGETVLKGGLRIETTLDLHLQRTAEAALRAGVEALDHRQGWRGPVRRVPRAQLEAEVQRVAAENKLDPACEPDAGFARPDEDVARGRHGERRRQARRARRVRAEPQRRGAPGRRRVGARPQHRARVRTEREDLASALGRRRRALPRVAAGGRAAQARRRERRARSRVRRRTDRGRAGAAAAARRDARHALPESRRGRRLPRARRRERRGPRAGRRLRLRALAVRPRRAGAPPTGFRVQALRLRDGAHQGTHGGDDAQRRAVLVHRSHERRRLGAAELRPQVPRRRPDARSARAFAEPRDREPALPRRHPAGRESRAPARHPVAPRALSVAGARRQRGDAGRDDVGVLGVRGRRSPRRADLHPPRPRPRRQGAGRESRARPSERRVAAHLGEREARRRKCSPTACRWVPIR